MSPKFSSKATMVHSVNGDVATNEKSKTTVSPSSKRVNVSVKRDFPPNCGRNAPRVNLLLVKDVGISLNGHKPKDIGHHIVQINAKPKEGAAITANPAFPNACDQTALLDPQPLKDGVVFVNGECVRDCGPSSLQTNANLRIESALNAESVKACGPSSLQLNANSRIESAVFSTRTASVVRTFPDRCGRDASQCNTKSERGSVVSPKQTFSDGCERYVVPISAKTGKVGGVSVSQTVSDGGQGNTRHVDVDASEGGVSVEDLKIETDNAFMEPSSIQKAFVEPTSVQNGGSSIVLANYEVMKSLHQNASELLLRPLVPKNMNAGVVSFHSKALEPIESGEPLSIDTPVNELFDSMNTQCVLNSKASLESDSQSEEKQLPSCLVPLPEDQVSPKSGESDLIEVVENNKHAKYPPRRRVSASRDIPQPCILNNPCSLVEGNSFGDSIVNAEKACGHNSGGEMGGGDTEQMENTDEVISATIQQKIVVITEEIGDNAPVKLAEEGRVKHVQVRVSFDNGVKQENLNGMSIVSPRKNTVPQLDSKSSSSKKMVDGVRECSSKKLSMESGISMRGRVIVQGVMAAANCPWSLGKVICKSPNGLNQMTPVSKRTKGVQSKRVKVVHEINQLQIKGSNGLTPPRAKVVHETRQLQIQESYKLTSPNHRIIVQGLMAAQNCAWSVEKHNTSSDSSHVLIERQGNWHEVAGVDGHRSGTRRKLEKAENKPSKKKKTIGNDTYGSAHEMVLVDEGGCSRHGKKDCDVVSIKDGESFAVAEGSENMHLSLIVHGVDGKSDENVAGTIRNEDMEMVHVVQTSQEMNLSLIPFGLHPLSNEDHAEEAVVTRKTVRETLRLFQGTYRKLLQDAESKSKVGQGNGPLRVDLTAAKILKETNKCAKSRSDIRNKILGCVPGVEVGDEFHFRVELALIGLHGPYQSGIDYLYKDGKALASSVVSSGGYDDVMDSSDVLVYSGQGGIPSKNKKAEDQKLERGNLSLKNSYDEGTPVRVIRGYKESKGDDLLDSRSKLITTYVYDGLYFVENYWQEKGSYGTQVFKFQLRRIPGQPELAIKEVKKSTKSKIRAGLRIKDISQGKERRQIGAINMVDDEQPPPFKYITTMIYPSWYNLTPLEGCQCTHGCSDSEKCACAMKNGGEIPYNYDGAIVEAKPLVYECGPSCRCPPSCHNRVTQRGIKFQLEIFKTESRGWGVRSLNSIPSGSFICEYTGELLEDREAELRTGNDEYLFDIGQNSDPLNMDGEPASARHPLNKNSNFASSVEPLEEIGFTIDAADSGSVGRFINHSCSPNCYAQNVLYDHDDKRMPHIMIFAAENIPPLQELAYHYNYELDQVRGPDGNIKKKNCYCGSDECTGRMY